MRESEAVVEVEYLAEVPHRFIGAACNVEDNAQIQPRGARHGIETSRPFGNWYALCGPSGVGEIERIHPQGGDVVWRQFDGALERPVGVRPLPAVPATDGSQR